MTTERKPTRREVLRAAVDGSGPTGIRAAPAAARMGAKTLLVENHSFFAGLGVWVVGTFCLLSLAAADVSSVSPARPRADLVQTVRAADLPGLPTRRFSPVCVALCGDYLYVSGESGIACFKRDSLSGALRWAGYAAGPNLAGRSIKFVLGKMYAVKADGPGLAWYGIDAATGGPVPAGSVSCPAAWHMVESPASGETTKDLYVKTCGGESKLLWFRMGAKQHALQGEVTGKGLGGTRQDPCGSILRMTLDGRYLYGISAEERAIACIERKRNGRIACKTSIDLAPLAGSDSSRPCPCASLAIAPDGRWLYAALWSGKPAENVYHVFRRDPDSGALTLKETISGDKDDLANQKAWDVVFSPGGAGGYLGGDAGAIFTFKYDAHSGRLLQPALVGQTGGGEAVHLVGDFRVQCGFLYAVSDSALYVFRADNKPAPKPLSLKTQPIGPEFFAPRSDTVYTWLGMAGWLINSRGTVIMIDPNITLVEKLGRTVNESGAAQTVPLPVTSDKIPRVDVVCYTHAHADHFMEPTPKVLEGRGLKPLYLATPPVLARLRKIGRIDEPRLITARAYESKYVGGVELACTPCLHMGCGETNAVGYLVKTPDGTIWHPGDTELIDKLLDIRGVDVLLFDIAAVDSHLGPEGSAWLARSCGARLLIAHHYGTQAAPWAANTPEDCLPFVRDLKAPLIAPNPGELLKLPPSEHSTHGAK